MILFDEKTQNVTYGKVYVTSCCKRESIGYLVKSDIVD